jgi:hypothetical protein
MEDAMENIKDLNIANDYINELFSDGCDGIKASLKNIIIFIRLILGRNIP